MELKDLVKETEGALAKMTTRAERSRAISDEKGMEIFNEFQTKRQIHVHHFSQIKNLTIEINTDSNEAAGCQMSKGQARATAMEARAISARMVKDNTQAREEAKKQADTRYHDAKFSMLILLVISVLLSGGITFCFFD